MPAKRSSRRSHDDGRTPTQIDIARRAKVSQVTVSHVLSGRGRVGDEVRERVLAIAAQLGYRPNAAARAISTGKFGCVALLLGARQQTSVLPQGLVWGIEDALEREQLYLIVARLDDDRMRTPGHIPSILRQVNADGLLINYTYWHPPELAEQLSSHRIPAIWINTKRPTDCVYPDEIEASRSATVRLLELGHRRIAYVDWIPGGFDQPNLHFSTHDRYAGYAQAMTAAGLSPRLLNCEVRGEGYLPASGRERIAWMTSWMSAVDRPTAVIVYGSFSTRPLLFAAQTCGLKIPRDLSVVTFHHTHEQDFEVPIATLIVPEQEMGSVGVRMLIERMAAPSAPMPSRALPVAFVEGGSIGSPG